jgi:hypothetical protein
MVTDIVTAKQATSLGSPQFVPDRNGVVNSAILVNSTFSAWQLPVDTYFQGDTTVTLWVKTMSVCLSSSSNYAALGNFYSVLYFLVFKFTSPLIIFYRNEVSFNNDVTSGMSYYPAAVFMGQKNDCTSHFEVTDLLGKARILNNGSIKVASGTWNHLAYVYEKNDLRIYVNGTLSTSGPGTGSLINSTSVNTTRNFNYLGMAKLSQSYVGNSMLDEVRLYNKALSQAQIQLDMATASGIAPGIC